MGGDCESEGNGGRSAEGRAVDEGGEGETVAWDWGEVVCWEGHGG